MFWRFLGRQKAPQKPTGTMKKPERHGLTLAPGDYSRVCKQTVPGARIFSPHLSFRFFHQAGIRHLVNLLMNMKKSSASNVRSAELNPNLLASLRPQNPVLNRALFADSKRAKTRRRSTRIQGPETPIRLRSPQISFLKGEGVGCGRPSAARTGNPDPGVREIRPGSARASPDRCRACRP